jgi:hypothetical protein
MVGPKTKTGTDDTRLRASTGGVDCPFRGYRTSQELTLARAPRVTACGPTPDFQLIRERTAGSPLSSFLPTSNHAQGLDQVYGASSPWGNRQRHRGKSSSQGVARARLNVRRGRSRPQLPCPAVSLRVANKVSDPQNAVSASSARGPTSACETSHGLSAPHWHAYVPIHGH